MQIKRITCSILSVVILLLSFSSLSYADNRDIIVYYAVGSKSAYRYHSSPNCPSLSRSTPGELTLEEAVQRGYTACSRCHPPAPDFEVIATPRPKSEDGSYSNGSDRIIDTPSFIRPTYEPIPTRYPSSSQARITRSGNGGAFPFILFCFSIAVLIFIVVAMQRARSKAKEKKEAQRRAEEKEREMKKWWEERGKYVSLYGGKPTAALCGMPSNCYVKDGFPACKSGSGTWGDGYTVLLPSRDTTYHRIGCSRVKGQNVREINVTDPLVSICHPCSVCHPSVPDLSWYREYSEIRIIRERYNIEDPPEPLPEFSSSEPLEIKDEYPTVGQEKQLAKECHSIPEGCFIGEDGLPACKKGNEQWGDGYTFYMTASGRAYHTRSCQIGLRSTFHPVNAYIAKTGFRYYDGPHYFRPCSYCHPVLPDLTWYENAKKKD